MVTPNPESSEAAGAAPGAIHRNRKVLILVALLMWGLTVVFALLPTEDPIPVSDRRVIAAEDIDPSPRFTPMGDDAMTIISVFERKCMECHASLVDNSKPRTDINNYHETVHMDHGLNGRCINCHDQEDRNMLVLRNGTKIGFSASTTLCSNCHGPSYRQWERGVHGKTLGFWDAKQGESRRLQCVECHNPHSPHYAPMAPLPGPNTLRMGDQNPAGHGHHGVSSPLMRGKSHEEESSTHGDSKE